MLQMEVYDIDDHHLEPTWGRSVADMLKELGDDGFVQAEGNALLQLKKKNSIVSLTGSNPLHEASMRFVRKSGIVVLLDVLPSDIIRRLEEMKVDRIVGQGSKPMEEILRYRNSFYEKYYDIRVIVSEGESPQQIAEKVVHLLMRSPQFISTRGFFDPRIDFLQVVKQGLAPDGGLFVPLSFPPKFSLGELKRLLPLSYQERALRLLERFHLGTLEGPDLRELIYSAYGNNFASKEIVPVRKIEENQFLLELFHGPTASFKDAALQLTPKFLSQLNKETPERYLLLVATSGDTGIATIEGFKREKGMYVVVLYPTDGVSPVQKKQMLAVNDSNVFVLGVKSDFDFCQSTVKKLFSDNELKERFYVDYGVSLTGANSINWGRLVPQIVYYFSGYLDLVQQGAVELGEKIDVCVPTGNFGNILAAVYAKHLGLPIEKFICASNTNNVLYDFFNTGRYDITHRPLIKTASPSIDILKSSNLERLLFFLNEGKTHEVAKYYESLEKNSYFQVSEELKKKLSEDFVVGWASEDECLQTLRKTADKNHVLIDTHTAVAKFVADSVKSPRKVLIASTAHFAKFPEAVLEAFGRRPSPDEAQNIAHLYEQIQLQVPFAQLHPQLDELAKKTTMKETVCEANYDQIVERLFDFVARQKM
jgi:threonine synthase